MLLAGRAGFRLAHATDWMLTPWLQRYPIGGVSRSCSPAIRCCASTATSVLADALDCQTGPACPRYLGHLIERYASGSRDATFRDGSAARAWFAFFGIASFLSPVHFIRSSYPGSRFFVYRVLLLIWAAATQLIFPLGRAFRFCRRALVCRKPARGRRVHALAVGFAGRFFVVPAVPTGTVAEGITWPRALPDPRRTDCFHWTFSRRKCSRLSPGSPL